ncbi:MAG: hypothetical protein Q4D56_08735 [Bacteroides sp.]|nr:hypothetical protein [Bacteroides sp.]
MLYFERLSDSSAMAMVRVADWTEDCTIFSRDTIVRTAIPADFKIGKATDNEITVNGKTLLKAEAIKTCEPYDMTPATTPTTIGKRLTEWRLGVKFVFDARSGDIALEANTRENMFIYYILNGMYYLRAAKVANTDKGTLFFQNIRLMKNPNTRENTVYFAPNNSDIVLRELEVDMGAFDPNTCHFSPDGGIYWSYVSHTPDEIILNGCGEVYHIIRQTAAADNLYEWISPGI